MTRHAALALLVLTPVSLAKPPAPASAPPVAVRPVATYSIVAREAGTGNLGVAVQSHWFSVGPVVPWAESGVGAVATQSLVDIRYGPSGLALMRDGRTAKQALVALTESDPGANVRQVAMIDSEGNVLAYTGDNCIAHASHTYDEAPDGSVYSCQANLMANDGVPEAMARAFSQTGGDLAERLMAALEAAEAQGGDIRGKQSAAMLIVRGRTTGQPWKDRLVDLRVEDNPAPLPELRRLLTLHRAYEEMNEGDLALEHNDTDGALEHYARALELAPGHAEMQFWTAVSLVNAGETGRALPIFARAFEDPNADWREVVRRLPASGLLPDDDSLIEKIVGAGK